MSELHRRDWARRILGGGLAAAQGLALAQPRETRAAEPPRIGLVLGAGSARGFAHIGVLKSLAQADIKPHAVVGCSAGALVGAFYAAGISPWQIQEVALRVRDVEVADFASAGKRGMITGEALRTLVHDALKGVAIEDMPLRYAAVATDLRRGELVVLRTGPVADAVRASCSIPGVFVPRELYGRELVDGGLTSPLPVAVARQMGCDFVVAVDVGTKPERNSLPGLYEVLLQSFEIMGYALASNEARTADLVIRPDTSVYASSDFNARREMIQMGYEASQRALPELRRRLDASAQRRRG